MRFECDRGQGYESVFPETFSFHASRHDPAELYLRLEDLWTNPRRLSPQAGRRDAEELMLGLLAALPGTLEEVLERLLPGDAAVYERTSEDVAVFCGIALRFLADKDLDTHPRLWLAAFHLRALHLRSLLTVLHARVRPSWLEAWEAGEVRAESSPDPTDVSFFYALAEDDPERIDALVTGAAERAYYRWLEDVCLADDNGAFESERSPFEDRASEVLSAVLVPPARRADRARDLSPFLRRLKSRDCLRLLGKLETWFLRQYDIHHAAAMRHQAENLRRDVRDADRVLSRHGTRTYVLALLLPALPFVAAAFGYAHAPFFFDALVSTEVALVLAVAVWFLVVRFLWKKDLTVFHTSVPRIGAGIIVGYLPVFMIDEVWDLARQPAWDLFTASALLGVTTLLYLYVEVQRRLGDPRVAFARARDIFLLGLVEAGGFGMIVTCLLGPLMAGRNWGSQAGHASLESLRAVMQPVVGELPRILGVGPFVAFPTAVFIMSFLAFFIGTFLQLLWEDLPITEPL